MDKNKINIGAGKSWYKPGWESLDSCKSDYCRENQHIGVAWDSKLPSAKYDILFAGNILEHVTNFKIERTIAEFNRIMKKGGIVRISVPDLKKTAQAYLDNNQSFFETEKENEINHIGIGGMFVSTIVSPGHDVVVLNNKFNQILGFYAHSYAYDFEMLKIYLEKWGFGNVTRSEYKKSIIKEMQEEQHISVNGAKCGVFDEKADKALISDPKNNFISGFDSFPEKTLFVEAEKIKDVPYSYEQEFYYNKRSKGDGLVNNIKAKLFYINSVLVDFVFVKLGLVFLVKKVCGKK